MSRVAEEYVWQHLFAQLVARGAEQHAPFLRTLVRVTPSATVERTLGGAAAPLRYQRFDLAMKVGESRVALNARDGSLLSLALPYNDRDHGRDLPEDECLRRVQAAVEIPDGACLVEHGYQDVADAVYFAARWEHRHEGLPVEGDSLYVLANGRTGRVISVDRRWRTVDFTPHEP